MIGTNEDEAPIEELKAVAHPLRFRILEVLKRGALNVGEIETASGIAQPALSQQLGVLRKAGLVKTRKKAKLVFYSRDESVLAAIAGRIAAHGVRHEVSKPPVRKPAPGAANFARLS